MRPIDADDILLRLDKRMTYEAGRNHAYLKGIRDAMKEIDAARTVDAIPVEWLKQWHDKLKGMGEYQRERAEDISFVLGLWQKEQGVR